MIFLYISRCNFITTVRVRFDQGRLVQSSPNCSWHGVIRMAFWRCAICLVFISLTVRELLSHINLSHGNSPNFQIICGINNCPMRYRRYHSFYKHVRYIHSEFYDSDLPNPHNEGSDVDDGNDLNANSEDRVEETNSAESEVYLIVWIRGGANL